MIDPLKLCHRCEELTHIKPEFKLCDDCEMEVLREWSNRLEQEKENAA